MPLGPPKRAVLFYSRCHLILLTALCAGCAQTPRVTAPAPVIDHPAPEVQVMTQAIDTGLEVQPSAAGPEPVMPLTLPSTSDDSVGLVRPEDAGSSPYPSGRDVPQAPVQGTLENDYSPAMDPALPVIENPPVRLPPPPAPPRKLFNQSAPPAVSALERSIENLITQRRYIEAASESERAIRIQPKNPELWHALAVTRLRLGETEAAEDIAKKSNTLARSDPDLVKDNWRLISEARRKRGDGIGAQQALEKTW